MRPPTDLLRSLTLVSLAGLLTLGAAACGGDGDDDVATTAPPAAEPDGTAVDDPDAAVSSPPNVGEPDPPTDDGTLPDLTPVDAADAEVLVGQTLADAEDEADARGWTVRVARLDGEDLALTEDYSPTRINVAVEDDVVVGVLFVG